MSESGVLRVWWEHWEGGKAASRALGSLHSLYQGAAWDWIPGHRGR